METVNLENQKWFQMFDHQQHIKYYIIRKQLQIISTILTLRSKIEELKLYYKT